ncbi:MULTISPECIES: hypothetical protein [Planktotalea]|jgi:hypothetical protein|uniref:hypothetical protein n=1 Tax=Planktotalea TaxID=1195766 RepID=UPI003218E604
MAERKDHLRNVAFGGDWSEEILVVDELRRVLGLVETAAAECAVRDVESEELLAALLYVRQNIEKGPMLCGAFFKALRIENQTLRKSEATRVAKMIREWAGL